MKLKSNYIFVSCIAICGLILIQMGLYALNVLFHMRIGFNLIQICASKLLALGFPFIASLLNVLVLFTISSLVWELAKQFSLSLNMYRMFANFRHEALTMQVNEKYYITNHATLVTRSDIPIAVTMGFFNPKIVLSTGLLALLNDEEIESVLHHEQHHAVCRDPLRSFLLKLFASVLWYIPALRHLEQKHAILAELLADRYAINRLHNSLSLGSALVKLIKNGASETISFPHVPFSSKSINYRIEHLLNPDHHISLRIPISITMVSLFSILLLFVVFSMF